MTEKVKLAEKEFQDIDQALRRAALKAKQEAERLGTPYVVLGSDAETFSTKKQTHAKAK